VEGDEFWKDLTGPASDGNMKACCRLIDWAINQWARALRFYDDDLYPEPNRFAESLEIRRDDIWHLYFLSKKYGTKETREEYRLVRSRLDMEGDHGDS